LYPFKAAVMCYSSNNMNTCTHCMWQPHGRQGESLLIMGALWSTWNYICSSSYFRKTSKVTYTHAATPLHGTHLDTSYNRQQREGKGV